MKIKTKILSLILLLLLCPLCLFSTACGKDDDYNLSSLEGDFKSMTIGLNNVQMKNDKIVFDYSIHEKNGEKYIENLIKTEKPYTNLQTFNLLVDNILGFTYEYIDECSSDSIEVDGEYKNQLKEELNQLQESLKELDLYTNQWAETIARVDKSESASLARFETLLGAYNKLYQKAINFSNSISYLYYNHALSNANPKISSSADSMTVLTKLKGRIKYQVSNLTQSFVEINIDGSSIIKDIVNKKKGYANLDLNTDNYLQKINDINVDFEISKAAEKAGTLGNVFVEKTIEVYNLQNVLTSNFKSFVAACNNVQYSADYESENLSTEQKSCVEVIKNNYELLNFYNNALKSVLEIIK